MAAARSNLGALRTLRVAAIVLAALALLDPPVPMPTTGRSIVILLDASDSMGPEGRARARDAGLAAIARLDDRDRVAVASFAGATVLVAPLSEPRAAMAALEAAAIEAPDPGSSDLSAALAFAGDLLADAGGDRAVILASDGRATAGAPPEPAAVRDDGLRLHAIPLGKEASEVSVSSLALPEAARPGELVRGAATVAVSATGDYELVVRTDGREVASVPFTARAGDNDVPFAVRAGDDGLARVDAAVRPASSSSSPGASRDDLAAASALLSVGSPGRVLVISARADRPSPVAAALSAQGMPAVASGPEGLPTNAAGYASTSCVVLDDLPADAAPPGALAALRDFVAAGGGLLAIGGVQSFGRGGWYDSPLEEVLPVETDLRRRLLFTRARLLFVIDSSGSMGQMVGTAEKQLAAMRAVAAALHELNPQDEVGVLGFDSQPKWVHRFAPAGTGDEAIAALSTMTGGGGTDVEAAILEALRAFGPPGPTKRHAILLTDGFSVSYDPILLAGRLKEENVSVTVIAVGEEVEEEGLRTLAEGSGGSYYRAELDALPLIASEEAASLSRDLIVEGSIRVWADEGSSLGAAVLSGAPPVGGYLLVRPKSLAVVHALAAQVGAAARADEASGAASEADPLLAEWRYGSGKAAVFVADSGARWLSSWSGTAAYNRLWSTLVRRVERPSQGTGLEARAYAEGGWARIVAEAVDADGRLAAGLRLTGRGADGIPFPLAETAPGRYEGRAPLSGGLAVFDVSSGGSLDAAALGGGDGERTTAWAFSPPGAESPERGRDDRLLSILADETDGVLLGEEAPVLPPTRPGTVPVRTRPLLAALALLVLLVELAWRSLLQGRLASARAALAAWLRARRSEADSLETPLSRADISRRR